MSKCCGLFYLQWTQRFYQLEACTMFGQAIKIFYLFTLGSLFRIICMSCLNLQKSVSTSMKMIANVPQHKITHSWKIPSLSNNLYWKLISPRTFSTLSHWHSERPKQAWLFCWYFPHKSIFIKNIWRRNVYQNITNNSPSNILWEFALFPSNFQKYENSRRYFPGEWVIFWTVLTLYIYDYEILTSIFTYLQQMKVGQAKISSNT